MFKISLSNYRRSFRDASGNMSIILALTSSVMLGVVGGAIDFARWTSTKTQMQAALDAAVLAGTQRLAEPGGNATIALDTARVFFASTVAKELKIVDSDVDFEMNPEGTGVQSTGGATLETSILKVIGINALPLLEKAASDVAAGGSVAGDIEISMVLDVTGSMCADGLGPCTSGAKLTAMKDAAKDLVNKVMWADQSTYTSKVAIVPFSSVVRVGADGSSAAAAAMTGLPSTWSGYTETCLAGYESGGGIEGSTGWVCTDLQIQYKSNLGLIPCVTDRYYEFGAGAFDYTDDAPGSGRWLNANDGTRYFESSDSTDATPTERLGLTVADPATNYNYEVDGMCWASSPANEVLPLSNNKTALLAKIDGLTAYRWTGGVLGTAFGWYTLSPQWADIWPSGSGPQSYSQLAATNEAGGKALRKISVIMTDGAFNTLRGWIDETMKDEFAEATIDMCAAMKAKGIEIYTVAYDLDSIPAVDRDRATNMLQSCGSDINHFYQSISAAELASAFEAIGNSINGTAGVRLTR